MKNQLETRLTKLKSEFEAGQKMLDEIHKKRSDLEATMLRISGAIQVVEELLEEGNSREPLDSLEQINNLEPISSPEQINSLEPINNPEQINSREQESFAAIAN